MFKFLSAKGTVLGTAPARWVLPDAAIRIGLRVPFPRAMPYQIHVLYLIWHYQIPLSDKDLPYQILVLVSLLWQKFESNSTEESCSAFQKYE